MSDDLREFLRLAAEKQKARARQPARRAAPKPQKPVPAEIIEAEAVGPALLKPSLAQLPTSVISSLPPELQASQRPAESLAERLHSSIEGGPGSLGQPIGSQQTAEPSTPPIAQTTAASIFSQLRTPQGVLQAVIISEVLQRPVDRWE